MRKALLLSLFLGSLLGCATTPEQRAEKEKREAAEEKRRHQEEVDRDRKKYAYLTSDEIGIRIASLSREISHGYFGYGWGLLIAKGAYDGKVKERDALATELARRKGEGASPSSGYDSTDSRHPRATGTGFFITDDGHFVTCSHVIKGASRIVVKVKSVEHAAVVVCSDPANDIALLKVDGRFKAIPYTSSRDVKLGQEIFTIGFPMPDLQGNEPKFTRGQISSLAGLRDDPRFFQLSAPVQPGNSGGPVIDEKGNVVAILSGHLSDVVAIRTGGAIPQNVNYATKSSLLNILLESVPDITTKSDGDVAQKFDELVSGARQAVGMVLVYGAVANRA